MHACARALLADLGRLVNPTPQQTNTEARITAAHATLQVNNQPPVLEQMATACSVVTSTTEAGGSALEALAAVLAFFYRCAVGGCCEMWYPHFSLCPMICF